MSNDPRRRTTKWLLEPPPLRSNQFLNLCFRFQVNPPFWGPMSKAKVITKADGNEETIDKRVQNQGKYSKNKKRARGTSLDQEQDSVKKCNNKIDDDDN
jgi:hypothetical protein